MKKAEIMYSCYSARIILLVGEGKEIIKYLTRLEKNENLEVRKKAPSFDFVKERLSSPEINGMMVKRYRDLKNGQMIYIGLLRVDSGWFTKLKDKKLVNKELYRTAFHESRHIVDRLVMDRGMDFEDLENTARIQADIDVEFKELVDQYLNK